MLLSSASFFLRSRYKFEVMFGDSSENFCGKPPFAEIVCSSTIRVRLPDPVVPLSKFC